MKNSFTALLILLTGISFSQAPQSINYQAVARNASGTPLANHFISLRLTIHNLTAAGVEVYKELQTDSTNSFGLFSIEIGTGQQLGANSFNNINWATGAKYLQIEFDANGGLNFTNMGTTQLVSVPYALHANVADYLTTDNNLWLIDTNLVPGKTVKVSNTAKNTTANGKNYSLLIGEASQGNTFPNQLSIRNGNFNSVSDSFSYAQFDYNGINFVQNSPSSTAQVIQMNGYNTSPAILMTTNNGSPGIDLSTDNGSQFINMNSSNGEPSINMSSAIGNPFIDMKSHDGAPHLTMFGYNPTFGSEPYINLHDSLASNIASISSSNLAVYNYNYGNGSSFTPGMGYIYDNQNNSSNTLYPFAIYLNYSGTGRVQLSASSTSSYSTLSNGNNTSYILSSDQTLGGILTMNGPNGNNNSALTSLNGYPDNGYVCVNNSAGQIKAGMYVNSSGQGIVFGDTKSFVVDHPNQPENQIWYACIEGPEAAMYERGTAQMINGKATVQLSETFRLLAASQNLTVQVTPLSGVSKGIAVVEKTINSFKVEELMNGNGSYNFDWEVKAVRKGHEDWKVIRSKREIDAARQPQAPIAPKEPVMPVNKHTK